MNGERLAHRIAYAEAHGPIPAGMLVLHKCDNPRCVNVDHLRLGTHRDNMDDMIAKGRQAFGWQLPQTKLDEEDREAIRAAPRTAIAELAERYGVARQTIRNVRALHGDRRRP